ncbi:hypothetical protein MHBO_001552 [Bonamia ostreae]
MPALSIENEIKLLKLLKHTANLKLKSFSTSLKENKKELKLVEKMAGRTNNFDTENKKMQLLVAIGEKKVLRFYQKLLFKIQNLLKNGDRKKICKKDFSDFMEKTKFYEFCKNDPFKVYVSNVFTVLMERHCNMSAKDYFAKFGGTKKNKKDVICID